MRLWAVAVGLVVATFASPASALDDAWQVGLDGLVSTATFPTGGKSGFGGGLHGMYGISDAFDLRAQVDITAYDIPEQAQGALLVFGGVGADYLLDIADWLLYGGAVVGPQFLSFQTSGTTVQLGVGVPVGLAYMLSDAWLVGVEGQFRLFFAGVGGLTPTQSLGGHLHLDWIFGWEDEAAPALGQGGSRSTHVSTR